MSVEDLADQVAPKDWLSAEQKHRVSIHEAGHGVVGTILGLQLIGITIAPLGNSGGRASFEQQGPLVTQEELERQIVMCLSGNAAEAVLLGSASIGCVGAMAWAAACHGVPRPKKSKPCCRVTVAFAQGSKPICSGCIDALSASYINMQKQLPRRLRCCAIPDLQRQPISRKSSGSITREVKECRHKAPANRTKSLTNQHKSSKGSALINISCGLQMAGSSCKSIRAHQCARLRFPQWTMGDTCRKAPNSSNAPFNFQLLPPG
jgi:hypothetical protein